jgi:flagellar biosynthesis component FlhA
MFTSVVMGLLAAVPIIPLLAIILIRITLRSLGRHLQSTTLPRRQKLLYLTQRDAAEKEKRQLQSSEDDGWEKIEGGASAPNGEIPDAYKWNGIIGFFHPFW